MQFLKEVIRNQENTSTKIVERTGEANEAVLCETNEFDEFKGHV